MNGLVITIRERELAKSDPGPELTMSKAAYLGTADYKANRVIRGLIYEEDKAGYDRVKAGAAIR